MTDVTADATAPGHRERKKRRTRETIARVALDLFTRQGYQETTIVQIAEAADVSPRTVSAYFPAKEQLVYADAGAFLDALERRLTVDREAGETAVDALRAWLMDFIAEETSEDGARRRCVHDLKESDPALRAHDRDLHARAVQIVAQAVAVDLDQPTDALLPYMVGAATMAALDALGAKDVGQDVPDGEARRVIDDTMAFVAAGVRELSKRSR